MLKSHPGWVPFKQNCRYTKRLPSPDELKIFGWVFSRQRLYAACRAVLASAGPLVLFFTGLNFAQTVLAPLVTLLVTTMVAMFSTTGGVMYSVFSGASSFYLVIPTLALIYPLSVGQPWIGVGMAMSFSWAAVFFWSWIDPTKRSLVVPKLYALLLLLLSFQATTLTAGWKLLGNLTIFWSVLSGCCAVVTFLSDPLCLLVPKHLSVALYNAGVILDACAQPLLAHARSESLPHFVVEVPVASLTELRSQQLKHNESIAFLLREQPFEAAYAPKEAARNTSLWGGYMLVNDCVLSISSFASRGIAYGLPSQHWTLLAPRMDAYTGLLREYISEINVALTSMYSGNGHVPNFKPIRDRCNIARKAMSDCYAKGIKKGGILIPGLSEAPSANIDHWIFMFMQTWKALNGFAHQVESTAQETSKKGNQWKLFYFLKATFMPVALMVISGIYLLRCLAKTSVLPFKSCYIKCCNRDHKDRVRAAAAAVAAQSPNQGSPPNMASTSPSQSNTLAKSTDMNGKDANPNLKMSANSLRRSAANMHRESLDMASGGDAWDPSASIASLPRDSIVIELPNLYGSGPPNSQSSQAGGAAQVDLKYEKKLYKLWNKSLTLTTPPKITFADYYREGRYKFPIRFMCVATPVTAASIATLLYWIPKIQTPWAISSCIIVMMTTLGATWRRFLHRTLGTVLGALLGQITVIVCTTTHRYVVWGPLIAVTFVTTYFHLSKASRYSYLWLITSLTYSIVSLSAYPFTGADALNWSHAAYRFLFVAIGSLLGSLASFILPEFSVDRYLGVIKVMMVRAHSAVKHIHESLSAQKIVDQALLTKLAGDMTILQATAVALRDDANAEVFYKKRWSEALTFMRYKARDVCYTTRMQIYSALTGFGSILGPYTRDFISQADVVNQNISYEVEYITTHLDRKAKHEVLLLDSDQARTDFDDLEDHCQRIKANLNPRECMQMSSHLTLFKLFCVLLHDIARATDNYF